jgi:hypothetical protein
MRDKDQKLLWEAYLTEQFNLVIEYLGWEIEYDQIGWRFSVNGKELEDTSRYGRGQSPIITGDIRHGYTQDEVYETFAYHIAKEMGPPYVGEPWDLDMGVHGEEKPEAQKYIRELIMAPGVLPPEKLKQEGEASGAALDESAREDEY